MVLQKMDLESYSEKDYQSILPTAHSNGCACSSENEPVPWQHFAQVFEDITQKGRTHVSSGVHGGDLFEIVQSRKVKKQKVQVEVDSSIVLVMPYGGLKEGDEIDIPFDLPADWVHRTRRKRKK